MLGLLQFLKLLGFLDQKCVFFPYEIAELMLVFPPIVVFLDNHLGPDLLQIFLKNLVVAILLSQVIPVHQHNISQSIVKHSYERVDLVVVQLIVQFPVDETFAVCQRYLVYKYDAVL